MQILTCTIGWYRPLRKLYIVIWCENLYNQFYHLPQPTPLATTLTSKLHNHYCNANNSKFVRQTRQKLPDNLLWSDINRKLPLFVLFSNFIKISMEMGKRFCISVICNLIKSNFDLLLPFYSIAKRNNRNDSALVIFVQKKKK